MAGGCGIFLPECVILMFSVSFLLSTSWLCLGVETHLVYHLVCGGQGEDHMHLKGMGSGGEFDLTNLWESPLGGEGGV